MTEKECLERGKGVLYHAPSENVRWHLNADGSPRIIPIGYQPFMRCQKQTGYVMKMEPVEDFKNDEIFERLYFNHSINLSNGVFEHMRQGEGIYPQEPLRMLDTQIEEMKKGLHFSVDVFEEALTELNLETEGSTPEKDNGIELTTRWCFKGK